MDRISASDDDNKLRYSLQKMVDELPPEQMRQLLYLFYGDHGSSPVAVLNMVTAHLQTPMRDRVTQGSVILKNYEMAQKRGELTSEEHIQPDVHLLKHAIDAGENAAVNDNEAYMINMSNM